MRLKYMLIICLALALALGPASQAIAEGSPDIDGQHEDGGGGGGDEEHPWDENDDATSSAGNEESSGDEAPSSSIVTSGRPSQGTMVAAVFLGNWVWSFYVITLEKNVSVQETKAAKAAPKKVRKLR